jgi:hypothetical protein
MLKTVPQLMVHNGKAEQENEIVGHRRIRIHWP